MQYFFVCGAPKSGTTWLQRLLDAHPALVCSGEGHFIERMAKPMLQTLAQYNKHLSLVAERVYGGKPYYDLIEAQRFAPLIRAFIIEVMSKRAKAGAVAIGDKTPRYTEFLQELRFFFPRAQFLHIVRDPRDVTVSRLYHALRAGVPDALTSGSQVQLQLATNAAEAWVKAQENFSRFGQAHPGQCLELRYEDLFFSPDETIARAFRFLNVSDSADIISDVRRCASFEKLSGRPPGVEDGMSFFRKGVVGDGKQTLDRIALDQVSAICGPWLERKGYGPHAEESA